LVFGIEYPGFSRPGFLLKKLIIFTTTNNTNMQDQNLPLKKISIDKESAVHAQIKQEKLLARIRPHRGHKLFKLKNFQVTLTPEEEWVEDEVLLNMKGDYHKRRKIKIDPEALYISALNLKNAIRKLRKKGYYIKD
jgi:hypothetical protein